MLGAPSHRRVLASAALFSLVPLAACSSDPDPADAGQEADSTAAALVEGLEAGDLGAVPLLEGTPGRANRDLASVVEGMGEVVPGIALAGLREDGDVATATLTWTWPLTATDTWAYDSEAVLERDPDAADGVQWRVDWDHSVVEPSLNAASVLELTQARSARADILGAGGIALVTERPVVRVGIDRTLLGAGRLGASAQRLAQLVDVDVAPYREQVEASGEEAYVEAIVFRRDELPAAVARGVETIPGARLIDDEVPLAPTRDFAAPILGTVGPVTAEMVEEDPDRYQAGDVAGLTGLQERYDDQLQGSSGLVVQAVGSRTREIFSTGGEGGEPLRLTLDEGLQSQAEDQLADIGSASAIVALRPSDGAILAAANGPGNGGQNLATFGQYAPGSTFKAVSSLALLRNGLGPDSPVPCTATVDVDGRDFENYDNYPASGLGQIPLRTAVANSCNTAFIAERRELGRNDLAEAAASLGLGVDHDLGFPAYFGQVPPAESETGRAADMIGQGTVLASPMAMAAVIASVQQGEVVVPRLLEDLEVSAPDGVEPPTAGDTRTLQSLLRGVVTSGSGSLLADVPGPPVIAKTGTAEYAAPNGEIRTHAWMIAAQGDLAVAVFVEDGAGGSTTAGPILGEFLRAAG